MHELLSRVTERAAALVVEREGTSPIRLDVRAQPLRGGLVSEAVVRVVARYSVRHGQSKVLAFVAKHVRGTAVREAHIYKMLSCSSVSRLSPRLLFVDAIAEDAAELYLEAVTGAQRWPWRDVRLAAHVIDALAALHDSDLRPAVKALEGTNTAWDYDRELTQHSATLLEFATGLCRSTEFEPLRKSMPALRRVVAAQPAIRGVLLNHARLRPTFVHGDVHPGNVLLRRAVGQLSAVLLDWERARVGNPLEDVSSWITSLAFYEPQARRRHDTLLARYLRARGADLDAETRQLYWLAGASNALSGALYYHLRVAADTLATERTRAGSRHAAFDWLRVVRRADAAFHA